MNSTPRRAPVRAALIALAVAASAVSARAEFFSGNELLERLRSSEVVPLATAIGYIMGVHDAHRSVTHCSPLSVTAGQARDLVRSALEASPSNRHMAADGLVSDALKRAWPCPAQRRGTDL